MYTEIKTTDRELIVRQIDLLDQPEPIQITIEKRGDEYRLVAYRASEEPEIATTSES